MQQRAAAAAAAGAPPPPPTAAAAATTTEFRIPPLWKRFAAEFIDFVALFALKLVATFVAVDTFDLIDLDSFMAKYDSSLYSLAAGE